MTNRCEDCTFLKTSHYLDANLLHGVRHYCWIDGKTVNPMDGKCNKFISKDSPNLKEKMEGK